MIVGMQYYIEEPIIELITPVKLQDQVTNWRDKETSKPSVMARKGIVWAIYISISAISIAEASASLALAILTLPTVASKKYPLSKWLFSRTDRCVKLSRHSFKRAFKQLFTKYLFKRSL